MEVAIMLQNIPKLCADSLRKVVQEKFNVKIKATHAHELVAAYFGYSSKNAMLADTEFPISNINESEVIILAPDSEIDKRRSKLNGLPKELPGSYELGEAVYTALFSENIWGSPLPPFKNFKTAAKFLVENDSNYQYTFKSVKKDQLHHIVNISKESNRVELSVVHATLSPENQNIFIGQGKTIVSLPRAAGNIGFKKPDIEVTKWSGGQRQRFTFTKGESNE